MQAGFELPRFRNVVRHALPNLLEATFIPLALFYTMLWAVGVWGALASGLVWSYACLARRIVRGERIPGILVLGAAGLTARFVAAVATGSVFVFYVQPTIGTVLVAGVFLLSLPAGRPMAERLAGDFCPIPPALAEAARVRGLFDRITILWAFVHLANAAATLYLLVTQPVGVYVVAKTFVGWTVSGTGIAITTIWAKRFLSRSNAPTPPVAA